MELTPKGRANIELAARFLELLAASRMDEIADMWAEDAVLEFPFRPPGAPERIEGKSAIATYFQGTKGYKKPESFPIKGIYPGHDPDVVFVEFEGHLVNTRTGERYSNDYIALFRFRDGKIAQFREFFDSLRRERHETGTAGS